MLLITCGVFLGFIDHAGVYILKLCPWFTLDLQENSSRCRRLSAFHRQFSTIH